MVWRGIGTAVLVVSLVASLPLSASDGPHPVPPDPRLAVVPTLREWHPAPGELTLRAGGRVVAHDRSLLATAGVVRDDLAEATGLRFQIASASAPRAGDIVLGLSSDDPGLGREGYRLTVGDLVTITAHSSAGVFFGSRSLLQLLRAGGSTALPRGWARDYPRYAERGLMLDMSAWYVSLGTLERYIRELAWFKFNDLQLELNDNGGFRLQSPGFPGLAAASGAFSQVEFQALEGYAGLRGVSITPEIDSPGHDAALTSYRPALARPGDPNLLNLGDGAAAAFTSELWHAYLPWFEGPDVAIGADEYDRAAGEEYRRYVNGLAGTLVGAGKSVRTWASLGAEPGTTAVSRAIALEEWSTDWDSPQRAAQAGYSLINASSEYLYIVIPKTPWYADRIDPQSLYERWEPNLFSRAEPAANLAPGDPHLLGAMLALWGDSGSGVAYDRVVAAIPVVAQKLWTAPGSGVSYAAFSAAAAISLAGGQGLR